MNDYKGSNEKTNYLLLLADATAPSRHYCSQQTLLLLADAAPLTTMNPFVYYLQGRLATVKLIAPPGRMPETGSNHSACS